MACPLTIGSFNQRKLWQQLSMLQNDKISADAGMADGFLLPSKLR
jgi:hypothetical protein